MISRRQTCVHGFFIVMGLPLHTGTAAPIYILMQFHRVQLAVRFFQYIFAVRNDIEQ
jgi:hypothetical protein